MECLVEPGHVAVGDRSGLRIRNGGCSFGRVGPSLGATRMAGRSPPSAASGSPFASRSPGRLAASVQGLSLFTCRPRAQGRATDCRLGSELCAPRHARRPEDIGTVWPRPHAPSDVSYRPAPGGHTAVADYRTRAKRVFDSPHQGVDRRQPRRTIGRAAGLYDSSDEALNVPPTRRS